MSKRYIKDVYQEISEEAASIANAAAKNKGVLPFGVHGVFEAVPRKLSLSINEFITDPELIEQLREIGFAAMHQALIERPDLTVGLILGDARMGNNHFERHR